MINKQRASRAGEAKKVQIAGKRGKASNRQGIAYGSRGAGRGAEHFEPHDHKKHSHGSAKADPITGPRRKTKEQRIVSG